MSPKAFRKDLESEGFWGGSEMSDTDRLKRWRLILGGASGCTAELSTDEQRMEQALAVLYEQDHGDRHPCGHGSF